MEMFLKDGDIIDFEIKKNVHNDLNYSCSIKSREHSYQSIITNINANEFFFLLFKDVRDDKVLNQLVKNIAAKCTQVKDNENITSTPIYIGDEGRAIVFGNGNGAYELDDLVEEAKLETEIKQQNGTSCSARTSS